jgi:Holliday junction resolvasome RuvABC endonuclease subunit
VRILGLDLSLTSTGYVLLDDDHAVWYGSVSGGNLRDVDRLEFFNRWIRAELRDKRFGHVGIEGYSFASQFRGPQLGELGGVIKLAIHQARIAMTIVPPATWKKALCGKGNLDKRNASVEIQKRYGVSFATEDTLDAWAVAMFVRRQLLGLDSPEPKDPRRRLAKDLPLIPAMEAAALDEKSASPARRSVRTAAS